MHNPLYGDLDNWLAEIAELPPPTRGRIAIACLRSELWLSWSLYAACQVYRLGYRPVLLYWEGEGPAHAPIWARARTAAPFERIDIAEHLPDDPAACQAYQPRAEELARLAVAHDLRIEAAALSGVPEQQGRVERVAAGLPLLAAACEAALRARPVLRAVCPSGVIGWSGAFLAATRRSGIPCTCVEFWNIRKGHMIWNRDRPAIDHDVRGWAEVAGDWGPDKEAELAELTRLRHLGGAARNAWLSGFHNAQRAAATSALAPALERFLGRPGPTFLLGPNVVGDSATLGRETIFASQRDWVQATCAFVRERPELNLVVRAHPDEVTRKELHVRMAAVARDAAAGAPNIFVLDSSDDTNTYAIADRCQAGLVWTSTLGPDLVMRGKPVLVAARAPYLDLGIGISAPSRSDYFQRLLALAGDPRPPGPEMVAASKRYQWILYRELSLDAATDVTLSPAEAHRRGDRERFYRMLVGELDAKGRS